jgi:outer membrane protein OmpA-like peptidoglycan-associated protein
MSAASLVAFGVALAAHPQPARIDAQFLQPAVFSIEPGRTQAAAGTPAAIVPVRWVGGGRGYFGGRGWGWRGGWHGGCCWGRGWGPGWGWGWGLGAGFGWGWTVPYVVAAPYPLPAPPPPAPAPAARRSFIVYFEWDRADLTAAARQVISQAAEAASRSPGTRLQVNGFTDLSGTSQYNAALSARRADAVAAELARDGVNRDAMTVQSFGKSRPAVQTADGLRDPHNRDVEIDLTN